MGKGWGVYAYAGGGRGAGACKHFEREITFYEMGNLSYSQLHCTFRASVVSVKEMYTFCVFCREV